ncbi:phosphatidylethanolamine-binding protein [Thermothelomyces heterothallicus CBS 202.75]|uniref:phosphatidylethanolamine-binding protein n=1 Tax=Thermothelomyces heterothallicus CBS 202.75 TaxID=1149848 RepID=UPI003743F33D
MGTAAADLLASLRGAGLLSSSVIPSDFTPSLLLNVRFPGTDADTRHGTLMRVSQVQSAPVLSVAPLNSALATTTTTTTKTFTLLMIDPDAPTPDDPKFAYWRHWVVANISLPATAETKDETGSGSGSGKGAQLQLDDGTGGARVLTPYLAPGPKDESRPHRYLFLLFAEPDGFRPEKGDVGGDEFVQRRSFPADEFVRRHGLRLVAAQWMLGAGDGWREE